MLERLYLTALALATLATALIAGFFYAYACSVMLGLARLDAESFIRAMQAINATVRNGPFAFSFFGALVFTGAAALLALVRSRSLASWLIVAAFLLYALGGFVVTFGFSVPLNDWLAGIGDPAGRADLDAIRAAYEGPWTRWNLIRAIASTLAFLVLAAATYLTGRERAGRAAETLLPIAPMHAGQFERATSA